MALFNPSLLAALLPIWAIYYWIVPYFTTYKHLRHLPGPFIGKFSNLWLALGAQKGEKYAWVHEAHKKYGKVVRVGYNHVSIASPDGMRIIYAHGNGFVKDTFYNSMLSLGLPSIFSTQDRAEHARKRKLVSHAFSPGAIHDFEPYMSTNLELWVSQLDRVAAKPGQDGFARVNIMPWCTYLAFDIIGDLAFGAPFGMIKRGSDECESIRPGKRTVYVPGARTLNQRGRVSAVLGFLPALSPWAQYIPHPFYYGGIQSIKDLEGMAIAAITKRLKSMEGDEERHGVEHRLRHHLLDTGRRAAESW
ncbi:hypothetical protein NUW58_g7924 [Xylaria curta]|uniref:Uncharacterized protein n=1 Tax=Xylaria curta TaxID=42375 RepID=A0ACC1NDR8_9PEZI|nr:hypothetical protein NUW58_g7924 [Xylaria curta]